jgi:hypothetical protein
VFLLAAIGAVNLAVAVPTGPVFPPPGGVTYSGSGNQGAPGGRTWSYSALNPAAYTDLYWGLNNSIAFGAGLDGSLHALTYNSGLSDTDTAVFTGTSFWTDVDPTGGFNSRNVSLRFQIDLTGATFVTAASLGLNPTLGVLADINGTSFTAQLQFLALADHGWEAINSVQQGASGLTQTSFSGGFYSTPPPSVPDTVGTFGLIAGALAALVALRRRA